MAAIRWLSMAQQWSRAEDTCFFLPLHGGHKEAVRGPAVVHDRVYLLGLRLLLAAKKKSKAEYTCLVSHYMAAIRRLSVAQQWSRAEYTCLVSHSMAAMRRLSQQ